MSYYNQRDHPLLDRQAIRDLLLQFTQARVAVAPAEVTRGEHLQRLTRLAGSELERRWLRYLEAHGHHLPSKAQPLVEVCSTRPDFLYEEHQAAIYIDGPHHEYPERRTRDAGADRMHGRPWLHRDSIRVGRRLGCDHRTIPLCLWEGTMIPSTPSGSNFAVGSLVKARGREWVVLPESEENLLVLRPLGGIDDEITGIYLPLEKVEPAHFDLPDPTQPGDYRSCRLLRDAVRLGFRSSAGPFRSFARIAVEPRPYQLVPLLMALKLDPVRILIADDVGVGKTIEACLVARELIDRGEVQRLAVLCPPQLAEQWQVELRDKFHIEADLVLPSTATRLERNCRVGQSLFDLYPYVIVSTDFIKSDRRRDEFLRTCPELVIVDEAHTCAYAGEGRGTRHQRHQLIAGLAANPNRHLILVTATPHSGKEEAFRSLLKFLNPEFANLPEDLSGKENERQRRRLAAYFVQRRRADIRNYLDAETPFPERDNPDQGEATYKLSPEYKQFLDRVLTVRA